MEPETERLSAARRREIFTDDFEEYHRSDNVGGDEVRWTVYGAINMALRCQMHHGIGPVLIKYRPQRFPVGDAGLHKAVARLLFVLGDGGPVRRVSQLVKVDDDGFCCG